jgi:D-alanine-D-alanine ligase
MTQKTTVALLFGGRSAEHEVSIRSAAAVFRNLNPKKFRVLAIYIDKRGRWKRVASPLLPPERLAAGPAADFLPWAGKMMSAPSFRADIYFPVLHGPYGEDGTIQGLLEMADVPFVGPGVLGSAAGMDKAVMKVLFEAAGVPVVPYRVIRETTWRRDPGAVLRTVQRGFGLPLFVKPANLGSSVGITKVTDRAATRVAIEYAFRYDRKVLVEKGIRGRELECSVLGNDAPEASLPGEVVPHRDFYDYDDKYVDGKTVFHIPARLSAGVMKAVQKAAVAAFAACECEGMARVDFFLERGSGRLYVNELNTIPGFSEISLYPKLWEASGLAFPRLVERLLDLGFERHRAKKRCVARTRS